MTLFARMIRSIQDSAIFDRGFENYYGAIVRSQVEGGPTAEEARRDFRAAHRIFERASFF